MKALIVDDERHARDAIRMLIDWEDYGIDKVMEAENITDAILLIETEKPEMIFTDMMMPDHDGIELLSWVSNQSPASKIIVVSGYKDFNFVRNTVKFGGLDYVLKPIDADQIKEVLAKAVEQWKRESCERIQVLENVMRRNQIRFLYWNQFFSKLLHRPVMEPSGEQEFLEEFGLKRMPEQAQLVIIDTIWNDPNLMKKLSGSSDLLQFIFHNISNEYLSELQAGFAFQDLNRKGIDLLIWKPELTSTILERINLGLWNTFKVRLHFGVGEPVSFPNHLQKSYEYAMAALTDRDLLAQEQYIHRRCSEISLMKFAFNRYEQHIDLAMCSGIPENITNTVAQWFALIEQLECITPRFYEEWWKQFVIFSNRWNTEHLDGEARLDWPEPYYVPLNTEGQWSFELWKGKIVSTLMLLSQTLMDKTGKDKHVVYDIARYLEKNYREDHSIQDIAILFSISKEHLSRKFKQELKLTPSDYLTSIRMKHAQLLLTNPNMKINAVACQVGYQDEHYFGKVFKKWVGITPVEYRKSLSREQPPSL
jgi:two-component system response regulator YesN